MRVAFYASGISPHISQICDEIYKVCGDDFKFFGIDKEPIPAMKIMGAENLHKEKKYFHNINDSQEVLNLAEKWAREADVAIVGCSNCYRYIDLRFESGDKLTFKLRERVFKSGDINESNERTKLKIQEIRKYRDKNLYFLAAGTFAPLDLYSLGIPKEKIIKWGYFPALSSVSIRDIEHKESEPIRLIWVGRFVVEKLALNAIIATKRMLDLGYNVTLSMIGYGEEEGCLRAYVKNNDLEDKVFFLGAMNETDIRKYLRKSHIFLMTSNYEEGWGAVVNEAMSEGCVPVVSYATGASQIIIDNIECGQLYFHNKIEDLVIKLRFLIDTPGLVDACSKASYNQIVNEWNAKVAVERLLNLIFCIQNDKKIPIFLTGPCGQLNFYTDEKDVDSLLRSK